MSFGIYNAFIFDRNYTMQELIKMMDFLRKEVRKPIDAQLHKYVLEKFLYYYYLRERLYGDEILEMLKKETDYDKKTWLRNTMKCQWKSLYKNIVLYIRSKVRNAMGDNLGQSLDSNCRAVLYLFAVEEKILCIYGGNQHVMPVLEQQKYLSDFQYWDNVYRPEAISEKDWKERHRLWKKAIGPEYFCPDHGFMINLYDTSVELFRPDFPFHEESAPDHDDILSQLMDTLYPDHNDPGDCQWNKLKSNCPELSMDEIAQIVKAK